jgi:hypothetical protein
MVPFMRQCGKEMADVDSPQMAIWHMRIACWIPKATNTHSEFAYSESVIAFLLQQWLHERASLLRYTYIACIVRLKNSKFFK